MIYRPQRNWGCRIREMTYLGMRLVVIENESLRIGVLAGKGSDIVELNYKPTDLDFVWLAPGGVRNPAHVATTSPDAHGAFRENYPGGWQEMLPNAGPAVTHEGALLPQHGEVYNVPWDVTYLDDTETVVAVRFTVHTRKSPFVLEKTIRLESGAASFCIEERLVNASPDTAQAIWGHHITFGPPFLHAGCRIRLPEGLTLTPHQDAIAPSGRRISTTEPFPWPVVPGTGEDLARIPEPGTPSDLAYLSGFRADNAWYEIVDDERGVGARIAWDAATMPYLWYWQEFGKSTGYPWWGRLYNVGLEPCSSGPGTGLVDAVANQTAISLGPGEERSFSLRMSVILT